MGTPVRPTAPVGEPCEEVTDGLGGVRYALEAYLDVVRGLGGVRDDHVQHEDHEYVDGDLFGVHRHLASPECARSGPLLPGVSVTVGSSENDEERAHTTKGPVQWTGPFVRSGSGGI